MVTKDFLIENLPEKEASISNPVKEPQGFETNKKTEKQNSVDDKRLQDEKAMQTLFDKHCIEEIHYPDIGVFASACNSIAIRVEDCISFMLSKQHCIPATSHLYNNPIGIEKEIKSFYSKYANQHGTYKKTLSSSVNGVEKIPLKQIGSANGTGLFTTMSANKWLEQANSKAIPLMLFDTFWHEGELCILFADTNLGKTILAVQIADSISRGEHIFSFKLEAPKQKVLYIDFELSEKQFENRYSMNYQNHHVFNENFLRAEINPESDFIESGYDSFEPYLYQSIETLIEKTGAKVLIIDNITYLKTETESAKFALPLMKYLMSLKKSKKLSILALAHTPKRDMTKPISRNDLQGSKMLINFCDSSFAIGESSSDKNIRYLKQIKARNTEVIYDTENVCTCQVVKPSNFLHFDFLRFGNEREHLKQLTDKDRDGTIEKVKEFSSSGKTQRQISTELGISLGAVNKYLKI